MRKKKKRIRWIISGILFGLAIYFAYTILLNHCPLKYKDNITQYAEENQLDPYFLAAVIKTESNFNENAASSKGAKGLMQITDSTEIWISKRLGDKYVAGAVLDPETSIRYGAWYLRYLIDRYDGNKNLAILAYNAGYGNVDRWISEKKITGRFLEFKAVPFEETRNYLLKTRIYSVFYKYLYDWKK